VLNLGQPSPAAPHLRCDSRFRKTLVTQFWLINAADGRIGSGKPGESDLIDEPTASVIVTSR